MVKKFFYIAVVFRVIGQSLLNDDLFAISVYFFDTFALAYISTFSKGIERDFIRFLSGVAFFNIINIATGTHLVDNYLEYTYFCCGIVYFLFKYAIKRKSN